MLKNCKKCGKEFEVEYNNQVLCKDDLSKQGRRNKRKGASNEHRFALYLQKQFDKYGLPYRARRTPRSGAIHDFEPADIMLSGPEPNSIFKHIHLENKNTGHWYIQEWVDKILEIEKDKGTNREPVVIFRKPNDTNEYAVVRMEFLIELLIALDLMLRK